MASLKDNHKNVKDYDHSMVYFFIKFVLIVNKALQVVFG